MPFQKKELNKTIVGAGDEITLTTGSDGKQKMELVIKQEKKDPVKRITGTSMINNKTEATTFLSLKRSLALFDDKELIMFRDHTFTTNNPIVIERLRENPIFGVEFFEGDYPKDVQEMIERERKYLTKEKDPETE